MAPFYGGLHPRDEYYAPFPGIVSEVVGICHLVVVGDGEHLVAFFMGHIYEIDGRI